MRFTGRDPINGNNQEPLTLHKYLYCLNDPINRIDPLGTFSFVDLLADVGEMGRELKEGVIALKSGQWAKDEITAMASAFNGMVQGYLNVWEGPDNVSDNYKFTVGFMGGVVEVQAGEKLGPSAGAAISSAMINSANSYMSRTDVLSWKNVGDIMFSAGVAAFGKYAHWNGQEMSGFQQWLLGNLAQVDKYLLSDKK